jgi:hypothetical protein
VPPLEVRRSVMLVLLMVGSSGVPGVKMCDLESHVQIEFPENSVPWLRHWLVQTRLDKGR